MANRFYPKFRKASIGGGNINLADAGVAVKVVLVDLADYAYNDAHGSSLRCRRQLAWRSRPRS